ncbi:hypothetical protein HDV05_000777 [Chytridiales sp. JEL 0842]|nr:hypothetical protein HDV05_000777 [Chytridiales sp. JEL 0842]
MPLIRKSPTPTRTRRLSLNDLLNPTDPRDSSLSITFSLDYLPAPTLSAVRTISKHEMMLMLSDDETSDTPISPPPSAPTSPLYNHHHRASETTTIATEMNSNNSNNNEALTPVSVSTSASASTTTLASERVYPKPPKKRLRPTLQISTSTFPSASQTFPYDFYTSSSSSASRAPVISHLATPRPTEGFDLAVRIHQVSSDLLAARLANRAVRLEDGSMILPQIPTTPKTEEVSTPAKRSSTYANDEPSKYASSLLALSKGSYFDVEDQQTRQQQQQHQQASKRRRPSLPETNYSIKSSSFSSTTKMSSAPKQSPSIITKSHTKPKKLSSKPSSKLVSKPSTSSSDTSDKPSTPTGSCQFCGARKTGQWRRGPLGQRTLCNACGINWMKKVKAEMSRRGISMEEAEKIVGDDRAKFRKSLSVGPPVVEISTKMNGAGKKKKSVSSVGGVPTNSSSLSKEKNAVVKRGQESRKGSCSPGRDMRMKVEVMSPGRQVDLADVLIAAAVAAEEGFEGGLDEDEL